MSTIVRKHEIGLFLDVAPWTTEAHTSSYKRVKKGTELTLSLNPETVDYDYIADEFPTTELDKYKPSIAQTLTMYQGEDDFDFVWDKFYNLSAGSDAKTKCMLVFMFDAETVGEVTSYKAWEAECIISVNEINAVDKTIGFDILFGGDVVQGSATMAAGVPTFTAAV